MTRLGELLSKLSNRYALGFAMTLCLGLNMLLFAAIGYLAAGALASLLGTGEDSVWGWFQLSAIVWAPLSVGVIMPSLLETFGPLIKERRDAERKADLARFVERVR